VNYRHQFHAGNSADVIKHSLLVGLVRALQRKTGGLLLLDTHAGRGEYELSRAETGDRLPRQPEHPEGIGRLLAGAQAVSPITEYMELVRGFDRKRGGAAPDGALRRYPGSPWLLRLMARPQDRLTLCELHPEECTALRRSMGRGGRVSVQHLDGYDALKACLPPPERRALILVDPPYEEKDEGHRLLRAIEEALRRFPSGVYVLWHPISSRIDLAPLLGGLARRAQPPIWSCATIVDPRSRGMRGSGLIVINPPWKFEQTADEMLAYLGQKLAAEGEKPIETRWIVPELPPVEAP
jgi:23S rRNA (adenine2030-N6)-methyltransferase